MPNQAGKICHAGVEIHRADGMSHGFGLFTHRQVCLVIFITEIFRPTVNVLRMFLIEIIRARSTLIHKIAAEIQIFFIPGNLIQAYKSHLGNFMSRIAFAFLFFRSERNGGIVCKAAGCLQKLIFSGGLVICRSSFPQMTKTVKFVVVTDVGENFVLTVQDVVSVQITVLLLGGADNIDGIVCKRL